MEIIKCRVIKPVELEGWEVGQIMYANSLSLEHHLQFIDALEFDVLTVDDPCWENNPCPLRKMLPENANLSKALRALLYPAVPVSKSFEQPIIENKKRKRRK